MARRSSRKKKTPDPNTRPIVAGLILLGLALLTGLSLLSISRGTLTEEWLRLLNTLFGGGRILIPIILAGLGAWLLSRFVKEDAAEKWEKPVGSLFIFLLLLATLQLINPGAGPGGLDQTPGGGGLIGWAIGELLRQAVGTAGAFILVLALLLVAVILVSGLSLTELAQAIQQRWQQFSDWRRRRRLAQINTQPVSPLPEDNSLTGGLIQRVLSGQAGERRPAQPPAARPNQPARAPAGGQPAPAADSESDSGRGILFPRVVGAQTWSLPPVESIFEEGTEYEISPQEIRERARIIEDTLASFGIEAKVREINPGPAVTQFGIEPGYMNGKDSQGRARKVRVSRIVNLTNDLALALAAAPIRIEAPIPGRPFVGIEVPNSTKSLVSLRGIIESEGFLNTRGPLRFALGRDVAGQPVAADLVSMPHLLIAGATGSGKSVCINSIIACLLATHTPETLRLLMVDPKMVELINYNGIPHLLAPVVVELERVVGILAWATREMDRRYKTFSKLGVRNLVGYNELATSKGQPIMPYVVIIIDELADLMMTSPDEIERTITRIAQMARATGIHLVIATQRPSTDVVTGLIKANFPARVAFAVTSQIDSRVILDTPGAERLLGQGDMLFMAPDSSKLHRLQGAFVSDRELSRLVRFWRGIHAVSETGAGPAGPADEAGAGTDWQAVQTPLWPELAKIEAEKAGQPEEDEMLPKAIELVRSQQRASISLLQRRLRVGYARAARLIDMMEERGIIGPDEGGGRSRQVLSEPDQDEE